MALYPVPHSPEWFDALESFDPRQAAHTRKIVELAGREDVCSVCGDQPTIDFRLVAEALNEHAVATIRLCDDCRMIRELNGESFLPLGG